MNEINSMAKTYKSLKEKIDQRMLELHLTAKKSLGQNFLIDQKIVNDIVSFVKKNEDLNWIEIGPGLGSLTDDLKQYLSLVIELDTNLANYWKAQGLNVVEVDALKYDWSQIAEFKNNNSNADLNNNVNQKLGLVSNLPYQISSRIVIEMSINSEVDKMVLMFQKEVADRILSLKMQSSYGFLSVVAQNFWDVKKLVFVSPNCFNPRPKVDSQVLTFIKKESEIKDRNQFTQFVKNCFLERRKKISNKAKKLGLLNEFKAFFEIQNMSDPSSSSSASDLKSKTSKLSLDMRAEELTPENFKDLFIFCKNKGSLKPI